MRSQSRFDGGNLSGNSWSSSSSECFHHLRDCEENGSVYEETLESQRVSTQTQLMGMRGEKKKISMPREVPSRFFQQKF